MARVAVLFPLAVAIAGVVWVLTVGTLLGALLIIGGVGALGWMLVPGIIDLFVGYLSTGKVQRRSPPRRS